MSAFAWLRRPCRPSSPPDASRSAGRRPDARRPASSSDSSELPAARAVAGVRHAAPRLRRGLRPVLAAALLALPLSGVLAPAALAQSQPQLQVSVANSVSESHAPGSFGCSIVRSSGTQASSLPVNLRISQTGDFLASGETGDKTFNKDTNTASSFSIELDNDAVDEPDGSATCALLDGTGYTVRSTHRSDTITIIDDDPTIASLVATSDVTFTEQRSSDTAAVTVRLSRRLYAGEQLAVPIDYLGETGIDPHDAGNPDYTVSVSGTGATGANLTSDIFYVQFTGHDTNVVQEATVTLTPTSNGDADTNDGELQLSVSQSAQDWADSSFTNVGGGGESHPTARRVRLTFRDNDITLTLSTPDATASEDGTDTAEIRLALNKALVSGETVPVVLGFTGGTPGTDFTLALKGAPAGVSLSGSTVTFTGPSAASATLVLTSVADADDTDDTVTVGMGTVSATGVTVRTATRSGNGEIMLLEETPYTPSPGPPLVVVDRVSIVGGSCAGRECEYAEGARNDIIINVRLVRPALEKGAGLVTVESTEAIALHFYVQPGVHVADILTGTRVSAPLDSLNNSVKGGLYSYTLNAGTSTDGLLISMRASTAIESDVKFAVSLQGPPGVWDDDNPPPYGVIDSSPYYITIKDGPDGSAGNIVPTVTVGQWHQQKLDGGVAEGTPVRFEVKSATAAQGPFTVYLEVEETAGDCVAAANERVHEVSFAPRDGRTVLTVPTVNDDTAEQDCTVKASLARADGTVPGPGTTTEVRPAGSRFGYTIDTVGPTVNGNKFPPKATATATVRDDDSVARKVSFVTNPQQVQESTAGTVDLVVAVDPAPAGDFTLDFRLSGTATRGSDYTVPSTVTVPSGATTAVIPVTILDDSVEDSGEWVVVHLEASGGYEPFTPVRSAIRIFNHEPGQGAPDWTDYQTVVDHLIAVRDNPPNARMRNNPAHIAKWNRVLAAVGYTASPEEAMPASEVHENAAKWPDSPFWAASVYLTSLEQGQDTPGTPEIAVSGGSAVTEGGDAVFTLTATPAPTADLAVSVTVATDGDWGVTAGTQTVTIPTTGSATLTLATAGDDADEPDGSVTVTVDDGSGYTVGSSASGTVSVQDDDGAPACTSRQAVADILIAVRDNPPNARMRGNAAHIAKWNRVLEAIGHDTGTGLSPMPASEIHANAAQWPDSPFMAASDRLSCVAQGGQDQDRPQQQTPEITVTADAASVTEGGDAVFTIAASPAPAADLQVDVTVAATGDYGLSAGTRTVTIPTSGSATLTLATAGDTTDEPDGSVTVTVADGSGWTAGDPASGTVAIRDDDAALPEVTIAVKAASVTEGGNAVFTLTASPAPAADLAVSVSVTADGDYGVTAGTRTVTIPTTGSATLTLATADDGTDEPDGSATVTVQTGSGYTVGASASGTVAVRDDDLPPPVVTIAAKAESVSEGGDAVFTLTADRAPDADLAVTLAVSETGDGDHVAAADEGPASVTIPKDATEAAFTVPTVNDAVDEPDGTAVVTVEAGNGYTAGDPASASVAVKDDDAAALPVLSVADETAKEGVVWLMPFTVRLSAPASGPVEVRVDTRPSTPVSAEPGPDYFPKPVGGHRLTFRPGETERTVEILILDDSHDEEAETFEFVLSDARGAAIGDGVAVGTIVNDDPMPAAWLARFGRTVAEQALDGIAGRMSAPRTAGMQGAVAGQAVSFNGAASGQPPAGGVPPAGGAPEGSAALAMAEIARSFGSQAGHDPSGFGNGPGSWSPGSMSGTGGTGPGSWSGAGFGQTPAHSRTMTARDALLGSSFSLTGEKDGSGGSMAFWGRAAQGSFDGREGTFSLDGTVTTGMLGADYARGKWLIGLALAQSDGEGDYRDTRAMPRPPEQICEEAEGETPALCDGAVRTGDGKVEASLTAAIPYAAFQASERLRLWGAVGHGTGEVTLKTAMGGRYSADTSWSMAAAGMRGDLLAPPAPGSRSGAGSGSGPALAATSDALWARTSSEKTAQLAASESDVTRLRVGLEGSYRVAMEDGASLVPKLEVGARHDGGDAETGFGVELGGGVKWTDPGMGLSLDLSGRTLIAHGNDDLKDRGFSAALAYDPAPATQRGASLSLRQDWGGKAAGGLDALFQTDPLDDRSGGGEAASRWAVEAAYGLPAFGGRWTGSPHAGFGLATAARDYSLGWRLAPEAADAPDLSFGVKATRREGDYAEPEHTVGLEIRATW